jgi:hypothetical protein
MMNQIFQDLITEGVVSVYLDDILIFTNSLDEHWYITRLVLDCMCEHKLYYDRINVSLNKPRSSTWASSYHSTRSRWILSRLPESSTGLHHQPTVIHWLCQPPLSLHPWILPLCTCTVVSHHEGHYVQLGLASGRLLQEFVTSAPVLVLPDDNPPFWLEADGFGTTTGAVLS